MNDNQTTNDQPQGQQQQPSRDSSSVPAPKGRYQNSFPEGYTPELTDDQGIPTWMRTQQPEQPDQPTDAPYEVGSYELSIPHDVPVGAISEEMMAELGSFTEVAREVGAPQPMAQGAVETFFDASAALGGYGQDSSVSPAYSREHAAAVLKHVWAEKFDANIAKVWQITESLGPRFQAWLDETGAGNDPRVCMALLCYPDMKLSKEAAAAELQKLMSSKEYLRGGDKQLMVRAKVLGRIAYAEEAKPTRRLSLPPKPSAQEAEQTAIRQELSALIPKLDRGPAPEREAAKKRWHELIAKL